MIAVSIASPQELVELKYARLKECARAVIDWRGDQRGESQSCIR